MRRTEIRYSLLSLAVAAAVGAPAAYAQEGPTEEITVTGSRIRRDADYQTPNPTTTIDNDYLQSLGIVNIGDALQQNPSQVTRFSPAASGSGSFFVGTSIANLRGLNPYFGTRTLTLVDSKRHVPTNQGGSVDLNFIPSVIVERMETVTGGASASYGSDAVTGVVNILLNKTMTGLRLEADYGASAEGDGDNYHVGLGGGTDLFDGRGHIVVGYEHQTQDPIFDCNTARDWCGEGTALFTNTSGGAPTQRNPDLAFPALTNQVIPGQPHLLIMSNTRSGTSPNGLLSDRRPGATRYAFNDAGTALVPYDAGQYAQVGITRDVIGGEGRPNYDQQTLMPDVERNILYTHFQYDLSSRLQLSADLSWGAVNTANTQNGPSATTICIRPDNAYLLQLDPATRATLLGAVGQQVGASRVTGPVNCGTGGGAGSAAPWQPGLLITKDFRPQQHQNIDTEAEAERLVLGLTGEIGDSGLWTWDAYYTYGSATRDQIGDDYITTYRYNMAVDAVLDANGQPTCRVNVAGAAAYPSVYLDPFLVQGCAPLNPFGQQMSEAAHEYAFDPLEEFNTIDQQVLAGSISGQLWKGWSAGPMLGAAGIERRYEKMDNDTYRGTRPAAYSYDTSVSFGTNWSGESDITEGFFEIELPLLRDLPGAQNWVINAAARETRYENTELERTNGALTGSTDVTSWKFQTVYEPLSWLRVRGSKSQDIRAAGFRELYYAQLLQKGASNGYANNLWIGPGTGATAANRDDALIILSGSPSLTPEIADTTTFGFVFSPGGRAEGLQLAIDYYKIELEDGIIRGASGPITNNCNSEYLLTGSLAGPNCSLITFATDGTGAPILTDIEQVIAPYYNDQPYTARGVDFSAQYRLSLSKGGTLDLRLLASHALEQTIAVGSPRWEVDLAGMVGGSGFLPDYAPAPDYTASLVVGYSRGPFRVTTQTSFTSDGLIDVVTPYIGPDDARYNPALVNTIIDNTVPSHVTQSVNFSYDFERQARNTQLWMSINNLWDKDPPFSTGSVGGRNGGYYDTLGRTFRLGVRFEL